MFFKLPLNVWVIAITFSLTMSGMSMLVFAGGIIGATLSPSKALATLAIALFVVGNAAFTVPAAFISQRFGRKRCAYVGFVISLVSTFVFLVSLETASFYLFCGAGLILGCGTAVYHQFRFAALESLPDQKDAGPALSLIMLCSIAGALLGPELASFGKNVLTGYAEYSGMFLIYASIIAVSMLVFSLFQNPRTKQEENLGTPRNIRAFAFQPGFIIAVASGSIGYAVMSFLMTSTPLSMHIVDGHSLHDAKGVIQAHLVAMFLPSLASGYLIRFFGAKAIMLVGCFLYIAVIVVAMKGQEVIHYWWALALLGVGWNFLFLSGTTLLPQYYQHNERFRAQAINDFGVFSLQACASLSSAWVLFNFGWSTQLWICLVPSCLLLLAGLVLVFNPRRHSNAE